MPDTTPPPRNLSLHVTAETKAILKVLAEASGMNLTQYVTAVLNDAVAQKSLFKALITKLP